jgi:predicted TIM-barrel fold metal-dependent hydrolase
VAWSLSLSTIGMYYSADEGNAETMRAGRAHDRLLPVGTLDPRAFLAPAAVEATLAQQFEMIRFFPNHQGWPHAYDPFRDILAVLGSKGAPVVMTEVGAPGEITALATSIEDYAGAVVLDGVRPDTLAEAISLMRRNPRVYLDTHALRAPGALVRLRDLIGIDRILFGSRAPGNSLAAALGYVRASGLSVAEQEAVLGGNAAVLWNTGEGK